MSVASRPPLAAAACLALAAPVLAAPQQPVDLTVVAESSGGKDAARSALPVRVIFVVDGSGSMLDRDGSPVTRWKDVGASMRRDLDTLAGTGVPADVTVVRFSSEPSSVEEVVSGRGSSRGYHGALLEPRAAAQFADDAMKELGEPGGKTALFDSIEDAVKAMGVALNSGSYSGGQIVVYSDGLDSSRENSTANYGRLLARTTESVRSFRQSHPSTSFALRVFGKGDVQSQVANALKEFENLGNAGALPVPARITALRFRSPTVTMAALRSPRQQSFSVSAEGVAPQLAEGLRLSLVVGGRPSVRDQPLPWKGTIELPASEQGLDVVASVAATGVPEARATVRAPALSLPANPREWGLPECGDGWGTSCPVGQPIALSVRVPAGTDVRWTSLDGSWRGSGPSATHPAIAKPGAHQVRVEVSTKDGTKDALLTIQAIEPVLSIEGPKSAAVGDAVTFRVAPGSGALGSGAKESAIRWFVNGAPVEATGREMTHSFRQRGEARVTAQVQVPSCGASQVALGAAAIAVNPVPEAQLIQGELVRGAGERNRIGVRVLKASRVKYVNLTFNGGSQVRVDVPGASASDDAMVYAGVPAALAASEGTLTVTATPEVAGDDGKVDQQLSDRGRDTRRYEVREPRPDIAFLSPESGQEASFEVELKVAVQVTGSDADLGAVHKVRLAYSSRPEAEDVPVQVSPEGKRASARFTPRYASGSPKLGITAQALDEAGNPVGSPSSCEVVLRQPKLELRSRVDQVHRDSLDAPDLTLEVSSAESAGWDESIEETSWVVAPPGVARIAGETKTKLNLQVTGTGKVAVTAVVRRGGVETHLGPVEVPIVIDPIEPDFRVTRLDGSAQVGTVIGEEILRIDDGRSSGPIKSRSYELSRDEGASWEAIDPASFKFASATRRGEHVLVRGTFGSIDGSEPRRIDRDFYASPDRNWPLVIAIALGCVGLCVAAWWLCHGNEFLGATARWSVDDLGNSNSQPVHIRWLRGTNTCSVISKRASLVLPSMYGAGEFDWVEELRVKRVRVELGGNLPKPQLTAGNGVGISGGSLSGRVRKTTFQPTAEGASPIYLTISPSPTASFVSWMSLTASVTAVWATFAFIYLRGYI